MKIPKINSINFGGKWIMAGVVAGLGIPGIIWLLFRTWIWWLCIPGAVILLGFLIVFEIEMRQDNGEVPFYERELSQKIPFDPEKEEAFIRSSICTGEKIACFRNREDRTVVEVMLIRTPEDLARFKEIYGLDDVKVEY